MPVTMVRLNHVKGLGPVLQLAEGWTVEIDPEIHKVLDKRTDPTWPTTWFAPRLCDKAAFKDVYSVMNNWGANHGAISYGHIGADLITLCSILRIPVCMHNVEEDKIFRPAAWNAFGMDKEGADFRACANFGPIYNESLTMKEKDSILKAGGVSYVLPFILITTCFALWGFANDITNPMVKAFSKIFRMSVTQGSLVQVAFYGGYFCMALPAAMFIRKFSYKAGVLVGLGLYALGALLLPSGQICRCLWLFPYRIFHNDLRSVFP